ncbi:MULTISPECIES: V0D/AC39 family V-type ATPase subunit [Candidatus Brocadia]|uniref:V-type ATP synthase subunit C n=1 Tax=Candidatus Brocadia sinica JPN1 TaxID=1197129 RepID=A0ABQ0K1X7_9BACT|nr:MULTISPECIES: V-type ATPase subunit [Brocadia]NOG42704.1 V-type ATPase subunit [Planctomycetota bacterium]GAN34918.1 hypothetical protein BROSI_A3462 [Candidatus Brocadia sinica JPN1]GIK11933.1 MAG: hypothetical protein BroJett002_06400 [Candidatus Brocadia sinica]GJQ18001.1 MAG: hypothetical protein HBSIN01_19600 [Candidatus Brocadia sinica]
MPNGTYHHEWCYLSGRVNILECSLLSMNFFEKLLSSNNLNDVLTNLNNTPLKAYFTDSKHLYEFETLLDDYYHDKLYEIRSLSPHSAICDFFLIRNDILNLKKFITSKTLGINKNTFLKGTMSKDTWNNEWHGKATSLPKVFKESISFFKTAVNNLKKESLPFIIDLICDGAYLRYIENFSNKINVEIIQRYLMIYQCVKGLKVIRRVMVLKLDMKLLEQYFLEGFDKEHVFYRLMKNTAWISEKTLREAFIGAYCNTPLLDQYFIQVLSLNLFPNISFQYEVVTDNYLLDIMQPVKFIPFGTERVFGYLCGLTVEVFNLKLVLGGKVHRIESNFLRERLRKTYA